MKGHLTLYLAYIPSDDSVDGADDTASGVTPNEVTTCHFIKLKLCLIDASVLTVRVSVQVC